MIEKWVLKLVKNEIDYVGRAVMLHPVNRIIIKISGSNEDLNSFLNYLSRWSYSYFHKAAISSEFENNNEILCIDINLPFPDLVSLCIFDIVAKNFLQLNFILIGYNYNTGFPTHWHILLYENGKKAKHLNRYEEIINMGNSISKKIYYRADHVNRRLKIIEEYIYDDSRYCEKVFHICYENYYVNYPEKNELSKKKA